MDRCTEKLIDWYDHHHRLLPWRHTRNIYHIWVCEVMSQQTTLAVVVPKFLEFVKYLPTVYDLATCDEEQLRKLWSGLGYYARARNLKKGAQFIIQQLNNCFPQTYNGWLEIPGCGPYTAAVIASVCFNEKVACVDGNVVRVVSRLLGLSKDVWSSSGKSAIQAYVDSMIPDERPGDFNQAMMELGATVCRKTKPYCQKCPLQENCLAFANNWIDICPPKKPRRESANVELFAVLVWRKSTDVLALVDRKNGFLSNTFGFPIIAKFEETEGKEILESLRNVNFFELPTKFSHTITHHRISGKVLITEEVDSLKSSSLQKIDFPQTFHWVRKSDISSKLSTAFDHKALKLFLQYLNSYQ